MTIAKKLTEEDLRPIVERWNALDGGLAEAARAMGMPRTTLAGKLESAKKLGMKVRGSSAQVSPAGAGRGLDEFRVNFDKSYIVPKRIAAALEKLGSGWQYEVEFSKLAGVNLTDLAHYRPQFEEFVVALNRDGGKRVWAGTKGFAAKLREMVS